MKQIIYTRPYSLKSTYGVLILLVMTVIFAIVVLGIQSTLTLVAWFLFLVAQFTAVVLDPNICAFTTTMKRNGSKVKIRRPLIGFARCETQKEYPDNIEGQQIQWRPAQINGRALIRI